MERVRNYDNVDEPWIVIKMEPGLILQPCYVYLEDLAINQVHAGTRKSSNFKTIVENDQAQDSRFDQPTNECNYTSTLVQAVYIKSNQVEANKEIESDPSAENEGNLRNLCENNITASMSIDISNTTAMPSCQLVQTSESSSVTSHSDSAISNTKNNVSSSQIVESEMNASETETSSGHCGPSSQMFRWQSPEVVEFPKALKCPFCNYKTPLKGKLRTHQNMHHFTGSSDERPSRKRMGRRPKPVGHEVGRADYLTLLSCHLCKYICSHREELTMHVCNVHNIISFFCPTCLFVALTRRDLTNHFSSVHRDKNLYKCDVCHYNTAFQYRMTVHRRTHLTDA